MIGDDLAEDFVEADGDFPFGIVRLEFGKVRNVADVVALAVLIHVLPVQLFPGHLLDFADGFEHRNAVLAAAAEVVDLAGARIGGEFLNRAHHIVAMNIVANLLALVAEDGIGSAGNGHLHQVGKKAVKFDAGVRRPGEAAAAENTDLHSEIAAVFLGHQVRRRFRGAKQRMQRAVNAAVFRNAVVVFRSRILPAGFQFLERDFVGGVAINLVGAQKDENRFGTVEAGGFEKIDRAESVDFEIQNGDVARLVVGGLSGAVNDEIEALRAEEGFHARCGRECPDRGE